MKQIFIIGFISMFALKSVSQGKFQVASGTSITSSNGAQIVLDNTDLDNDGSIEQSAGDGSFIFSGSGQNVLSGKGLTRFDRLVISKPDASTLLLTTNISVSGRLQFTEGRLNLSDNNIYLGNTGALEGETESAHVFSTGRGFIESTHDQNNAVNINPGNLGAMINSTSHLGMTIIRRGHLSQLNTQNGSQSILRYYDILPSNNSNINATVRFRYFDNESNNIDESEFSVLRSANGVGWNDLGADAKNASANFVEKKGITQFSRFTLSTPESTLKASMALWPNPVISTVTIGITSLSAANLKIQVYNSKGALVQVQDNQIGAGVNQVKLNMTKLPQGNYTIHTNFDGKTKITAVSKM